MGTDLCAQDGHGRGLTRVQIVYAHGGAVAGHFQRARAAGEGYGFRLSDSEQGRIA